MTFYYCCLSKLPSTQHLKPRQIYFFHSSGAKKSSGLRRFICFRSHKAEIKVSIKLDFIKELWNRICFQVYSSCRQNSIQCVCRTEFPVPLLAIRQMPVLVLAHINSQALHMVPSSDRRSSIFHVLSLSEFSFCYF